MKINTKLHKKKLSISNKLLFTTIPVLILAYTIVIIANVFAPY